MNILKHEYNFQYYHLKIKAAVPRCPENSCSGDFEI